MNPIFDPAQWTLTERQQFLDKGWRSRRNNEYPPVSQLVRPMDYLSEYDCGTVDFFVGWRNYAFLKVIFPPNITVRNCNFAQAVPGTDALSCDNVTFIDCNLVNVRIKPGMNVPRVNNAQSWFNPTLGERIFICGNFALLKGDEVAPQGCLTTKPSPISEIR